MLEMWKIEKESRKKRGRMMKGQGRRCSRQQWKDWQVDAQLNIILSKQAQVMVTRSIWTVIHFVLFFFCCFNFKLHNFLKFPVLLGG